MRKTRPTDTNAPTQFPGAFTPFSPPDEPTPRAPANQAPTIEYRASAGEPERFRPLQRPPIPRLAVQDDNQTTAEHFRIRKSPFRIGRLEGDFIIPFDLKLSASHAELYVENNTGSWRWHLRDLGSTNGTFAQVNQMKLKPGQVILIGRRRYRLEGSGGEAAPAAFQADRTQTWPPSQPAEATVACLLDIDGGAEARRFPLTGRELWMGRDAQECSVVVDDPLVNARHARLYRDERGTWHIEDQHSLNGVWAQIDDLILARDAGFQCGEQRFQFKLG